MLQQLYEQLAARYTTRPHKSGLTVVDNLSASSSPFSPTSSSAFSSTSTSTAAAQAPASSGWWSRFTQALNGTGGAAQEVGHGGGGRPPIPRGLYMFGGVGCGKTMLMDLLVESVPREFKVCVGGGGGRVYGCWRVWVLEDVCVLKRVCVGGCVCWREVCLLVSMYGVYMHPWHFMRGTCTSLCGPCEKGEEGVVGAREKHTKSQEGVVGAL